MFWKVPCGRGKARLLGFVLARRDKRLCLCLVLCIDVGPP